MTVLKRFAIALDIKRPGASPNIEVVEGDNGNVFEVTLTDNGVAVDLSNCRVVAVFALPDGTTAQQDNDGHGITVDTVNKNEFDIELYTGSFLAGTVNCEIQIYSGTGQDTLATTAWFNFKCRTGIANEDTIPATNEWPILVDMMNRVDNAEAELATLIDDTEAATAAANSATSAANEAAENANDTNTSVSTAESARVTAESGRVSAESSRVTAESGRVSAESLRVTAESERASAESTRASHETSRVSAETSRANAETARASAETSRGSAETSRASAESSRVTAESGRVSAESARASAETSRASAETARASAETARESASATAVSAANSAASYAETQGDYAKEMGDAAAAVLGDGNTWDTLPGKPLTFPPSTHGHTADDITDGTTNKAYTATERTKLGGIETGANNYVHPATSGNKHVPSGGAAGNFLKYSADGTAAWVTPANTDVGAAAASHTHGNVTTDGKIGSTANLPVFTGTSGLLETKTVANAISALGIAAYEEGTWTPTLYGYTTAGTPSYSSRNGYYKKIGNIVLLKADIVLSDKSTMAGNICLGGLPFTPSMGTTGEIGLANNLSSLTKAIRCRTFTSGTYMELIYDANTVLAATNLAANTAFYGISIIICV